MIYKTNSSFVGGICAAVLGFSMVSCNATKFVGSEGKDDDKPNTADEVAQCEQQGDGVNLKFPKIVQDCIDQKKIFHFPAPGEPIEKGACTDVETATFTTCNFQAIKDAIAKLGMPTTIIDDAQKKGAFLVGCGEKNQSKTIVAQWFYTQGDHKPCEFSPEKTPIVTSCFKQYIGQAPPAPNTAEEKRLAVAKCMSESN